MKVVRQLNLIGDTAQEQLPDYVPEFPCITTRAELHCYPESHTPWHWHAAAELFYMAAGELDYHLPDQTLHFGQGSGGLLMPNVLHSTSWRGDAPVVALVHLFDTEFLFGEANARMAQKYVAPILNDPQRALLALPEGSAELEMLRASFEMDSNKWEYEYELRDALCGMWLRFQKLSADCWRASRAGADSEIIKTMLSFIRMHLAERLDVRMLAEHTHVSERTCYRIFRDALHISPNRYIQELRLRRARGLLRDPAISVTDAALSVGFDDIGYFGRLFRKSMGMSPTEYRKWQNNANE